MKILLAAATTEHRASCAEFSQRDAFLQRGELLLHVCD
jgi:hypothetical protein